MSSGHLFVLMLITLVTHHECEQISYTVVPMDLAHWGSTRPQYLHLYITGDRDTDLEITIPANTFFRDVSLREENNWAWKQEYHLEGSMLNDSIAKGIRIEATWPVNIYVTRNCTYSYSLTSFNALPISDITTSFLLAPYIRTVPSSGYEPIYVIAAENQQTNITVFKYDEDTGIPSVFEERSLKPNEVHYQEIISTTSDYAIGMELNSSHPVSVFVGNKRSTIPSGYGSDISAFTQIPESSAFQSFYIIGPIPGDFENNGFSVLVVFSGEETEANILYNPDHTNTITIQRSSHSCSCGSTTGRCSIACSTPITKGAYVEFATANAEQPVILESSKPCLAMMVKHSQTSGYQRPYGYISPTAPPSTLSALVKFFVPHIGESDTAQVGYVNIAVPSDRVTGIILDDKSYQDLLMFYDVQTVTVETWTVVTIQVASGIHSVYHKLNTVPVTVHVHVSVYPLSCSSCAHNAFGFPAQFKLSNVATPPAQPNPDESEKLTPEMIAILVCLGVLLLGMIAVVALTIINCKAERKSPAQASQQQGKAVYGNIAFEDHSSSGQGRTSKNRYNKDPTNRPVSGTDELYEEV